MKKKREKSQRQKEFSKLTPVDKKVVLWLKLNAPQALSAWPEYIQRDYKNRQLGLINKNKLAKELASTLK